MLLLTDGRDTCSEMLSVQNVQLLASAGAPVFVVGFDGTSEGIDNALLNNLACAGRTASDFDTACTDSGAGDYVASNPEGPPLYLRAGSSGELSAALEDIAGEVCCGCVD